jgi:hypothetical protein
MGRLLICAVLLGGLLIPTRADAYSVLSHEAMVDAAWADVIAPLLRQKFPQASTAEIEKSRAYAYGGSVIQDLGYYPFGSHFFTNLLHYVRSGDFVEAMVRDSQTLEEYAFALGALAHYASDNAGHPLAVNRAVALMYPKARAKYGDEVTYVEDPKRHIMVEFAFDVSHVAKGTYAPDTYHRFIGFEVSKPLLERAFKETYGLDLKDMFLDEDLAIGTYRFAVSKLIPDLTRAAAKDKKDALVYTFTRQEFEQEFGTKYRKPGFVARFIVLLTKVMPRVGPFKPLDFDPPSPQAEQLFADSFARAATIYRDALGEVRANRLTLANTDFDTGRPTRRGEYPLADDTYAELVEKLADRPSSEVPQAIRADITRFYGSPVLTTAN